MTKDQIIEALNTSQVGLGKLLGVKRAAVCKWKSDKAIPRGRWYELRAKRPDLFGDVPDPYSDKPKAKRRRKLSQQKDREAA